MTRMTQFDAGAAARPDVPPQPVLAVSEDSIPAARLLAHDLEALVWDDDGDERPPAPGLRRRGSPCGCSGRLAHPHGPPRG